MARFTIQEEEALNSLESIARKRGWNSFTTNIYEKHIREFDQRNYVSYSRTGRQHNKCNCTPRELRKYILRDSQKCIEIDVKSCAPNLLINYFKDPDQRKKWQSWINEGRFYEEIGNAFNRCRDGGKDLFKYWLGGWDKSPLIKWIDKNFPDLNSYSENMAVLTQTDESKVFVEAVRCKAWSSIHDGLLVPVHELKESMDFVKESFKKIHNLDVIITFQ